MLNDSTHVLNVSSRHRLNGASYMWTKRIKNRKGKEEEEEEEGKEEEEEEEIEKEKEEKEEEKGGGRDMI